MRKSNSLSIMFALLLALPTAAQITPSSARFLIRGTVVHTQTGQPVARANVAIGYSDKPGGTKTVRTDTQGRFQFEGLPPGKYWLAAEARGFPRQGFNDHEFYSTGIAIGPGLQSDNIVFRLRPGGSISGTVTDENNEVMRGAQVMLLHSRIENGMEATILQTQAGTDDEGRYRFSQLAAGTYFVAVSARPWFADRVTQSFVFSGPQTDPAKTPDETVAQPSRFDIAYPITFYPSVTSPEGVVPLVLKFGDEVTADISLTAVPAAHIRLRQPTTNSAGGFYPSSIQEKFRGTTINVPMNYSSNSSGEIASSGIAPGRYDVTMTLNNDDSPSSWTQAIDVYDNLEISPTMPKGAAFLVGHVSVNGGGPVANGTVVRLSNLRADVNADGQVGEKGEFRISESLVPGTYEIQVFNVRDQWVSSVSATGAKVVGRSVEISGGRNIQLEVKMSRAVSQVKGTALTGEAPTAGAMIVLVPDDLVHNASLVRRDQSDSDGTFTLRSVLPGRYTVLALEHGWEMEWMNPETLKPYLAQGTVVDVFANKEFQVKAKVQ